MIVGRPGISLKPAAWDADELLLSSAVTVKWGDLFKLFIVGVRK